MNEEPTAAPKKSPMGIIIAIIAAVLVTVGAILAIALNQETTAPASTQTTETGDTQTKPDTSEPSEDPVEAATITFTNSGFSPSTITVKKGTVVTVVNSSDTEVQFSSDNHPTHRENPEMNLSEIGPGEKASFTADTVGTHGFHDHIDDSKTGTLVVTE